MRRIHLDAIGGIAGDMFVAAVGSAFPGEQQPLLDCLANLRMPVPVTARFMAHQDGVMAGTRFVVATDGPEPHGHAPGDAYHRHDHVSHAWIVRWLDEAVLEPAVRAHAKGIFRRLAEAEAAVHGIAVEAVEFHEVGAWDSIADIVAAAFLIDAIGPAQWTHGPLPLGSGTLRTAHGVLPVPAPATVHLMIGMPVVDDGIAGERVTPTGAAILAHVGGTAHAAGNAVGDAPMQVEATGSGFGTRRLPGRPNVLRCVAYQLLATPASARHDSVDTMEFEIDDQSPEDLAAGLDRLRDRADVLQVYQTPTFGKKGRLASRIQVLARAGSTDAVADACFTETTTLGLRVQRVERRLLERGAVHGDVRVKLAQRPAGSVTAKAEMDDLAALPGGRDARERARRNAESEALERHAPPKDPEHDG
jgi:uncharacterized protein (TIGR00299 family) protein